MKKFLVVIIILIGLLALPFIGGTFVVMIPVYGQTVTGAYKILGYDLNCSDLHGGWQCRLGKSHLPTHQESLPTLKFGENFGCKSDADCFVTDQGKCVTGKVLAESLRATSQSKKSNSAQCKCLTGPTVYGCVPAEDPLLQTNAKTL
jgi:hypothetical protein